MFSDIGVGWADRSTPIDVVITGAPRPRDVATLRLRWLGTGCAVDLNGRYLPRARSSAHPCRVTDLDFFVDVVVSGAVLGVGLTDSPEAVARVLGDGFAEDRGRATLRRDYGLVEFFWSRRTASEQWRPDGFSVQAHRLPDVDVGDDLAGRYGRFGGRLRFASLGEELARLGYRLEEVTSDADRPGYRRFWLAESQAVVTVAATGWEGRIDEADVWSISAPWRPEAVAAATLGVRRQAVKDGLTHLLRLGAAERIAWLDRRQPPPDERANWWLYLLLVSDAQVGVQADGRPDWVALKLWLLRQARARAVFTPADCALKMAHFVADMRRVGHELAVLPSADEVVHACLAAIPAGPDEVALLDDRRDLSHLDHNQIRQSRQARNLVSAAEWHLGHVQDRALADRLRQWLNIKPRLV